MKYRNITAALFLFIALKNNTTGVIEIVVSRAVPSSGRNERLTANTSIGFFDVAAWDRFKARQTTTLADLIEFQTGSRF